MGLAPQYAMPALVSACPREVYYEYYADRVYNDVAVPGLRELAALQAGDFHWESLHARRAKARDDTNSTANWRTLGAAGSWAAFAAGGEDGFQRARDAPSRMSLRRRRPR